MKRTHFITDIYSQSLNAKDNAELIASAPDMSLEIKELQAEIEKMKAMIKSDSVYTLLRYGYKSPSSSGMDDCDDKMYLDLYNLCRELQKSKP